jgi:hypothetical protein
MLSPRPFFASVIDGTPPVAFYSFKLAHSFF